MRTIRYKPEYFAQTVELLRQAKNNVNLPSDIFDNIARLFEDAEANQAALNKLFAKAYTILTLENEIPVGIASMDKDGEVGIFAAIEGETFKRACKHLSNDLDRRAAKRDIPMLTVFPVDGKANIFFALKYETYDAASDEFGVADEFMLAKKIKLNDDTDLNPEQAKKLVLNPSKKITVEGIDTVFPFVLFGVACFFIFLLAIITATNYDPSQLNKFIMFFIIFGLFFAVASGIFIAHFVKAAKRKKKVLSMNVTNGVITMLSEHSTYSRVNEGRLVSERGAVEHTYVYITYIFYDANGQKREAQFRRRYNGKSPYFYPGQKLVVAYNESESFILRKYTLVDDGEVQSETEASPLSDFGEGEPYAYATAAELSKYVPINGVKRYYVYAASPLAVVVIVFIITSIFSAIAALESDLSFGWLWLNFWPFHLFTVVLLGIPGAVLAIIPARANAKYKRLIRQPYVIICDGKLVHSSPTHKANNKLQFYCQYKLDGKKIEVKVPKMIGAIMLKRGDTSVKVVYDKTTATVVVKKGKFPDVIKLYNRN